MKIEKLTENKIRVILNSDELGFPNMNVSGIMAKAIETQEIFSDILKKAEKEVDFYTDGYKLLIEAFSSLEDIVVFTITKFLPDNTMKKKKLLVKRKSFDKISEQAIYRFHHFDDFCEFCNSLQNLHKIDSKKIAKHITLYLWKDAYYLVLKNINTKYENIDLFHSVLSEFGKLLPFSNSFDYKLLEHGKVIIKKNAIEIGMLYF